MKTPKPSDFDWVTARHKCSAAVFFESLLQLAKANVDTVNAAKEKSSGRSDAYLQATVPGVFAVARGVPGAGPPKVVRFRLERDDAIAVEPHGVPMEGFQGTLTLNNEGECRLKVGAEELDLWQVLRRALEPLFFGLQDWQI
jgi:hypothetical protein